MESRYGPHGEDASHNCTKYIAMAPILVNPRNNEHYLHSSSQSQTKSDTSCVDAFIPFDGRRGTRDAACRACPGCSRSSPFSWQSSHRKHVADLCLHSLPCEITQVEVVSAGDPPSACSSFNSLLCTAWRTRRITDSGPDLRSSHAYNVRPHPPPVVFSSDRIVSMCFRRLPAV
ncbi:hypothetical protein BDP55DRAFT_305434 [Colletotrichum godetiae]|uniref:Uncharacterized protein n=1 Tax=Colletotrichum godetiae TaxID=1209918 RepID=A0AAJ0F2R2_9PEZI|nr:uncharacterized protein BDP55DRAFT_305434 [Colletotrichum godetiae]KAK1690747.1 hypothetical protein BDP55DRAFT_305434 [Colletotrichum godetiae]